MKQHTIFKILLLLLFGGSGKDCWAQEQSTTTLQQTEQPKLFSIDEKTGRVVGCDLIQLSKKTNSSLQKSEQVSINVQQSLYKKIKKKGDVLFTMMTSDKKHLICLDGSHGDYLNAIYFFDSKLKLVNKFVFDEAQLFYVRFNESETFLCVSGQFNGNFYFFTTDGRLKNHGNFNKLTGDDGTSYGEINISKNGKIWLLQNNETWIYDNNESLVGKIKVSSNSKFDDTNDRIIYINKDKIHIYNYRTRKIDFISETMNNLNAGYFKNGKLFLNLNDKIYEYECTQK